MPLVVITGPPASGKTDTARRIRQFLEVEKGKIVHLISENEITSKKDFDKNSLYADSKKEKIVRGELRSEVARCLAKDEVVILDGLNYIKGFRYELFCASKAAKTPQVTVYCDVSKADCILWNRERPDEGERYNSDILDGLFMRYEEPCGQNRWDSPLLLQLKAIPVDLEALYGSLFERKAPPPNQSTQCQPLSSTNFLQELDRVTKEIIAAILEAQKLSLEGESISVPGTQEKYFLAKKMTMAELARVKRQFINYAKVRAIEDVNKLNSMFVQYLNTSLSNAS